MKKFLLLLLVALLCVAFAACGSSQPAAPVVPEAEVEVDEPETDEPEASEPEVPNLPLPEGGDGMTTAGELVRVWDIYLNEITDAEITNYSYEQIVELFGGIEADVVESANGEVWATWKAPEVDDGYPKWGFVIEPSANGKWMVNRAGSFAGLSQENTIYLRENNYTW